MIVIRTMTMNKYKPLITKTNHWLNVEGELLTCKQTRMRLEVRNERRPWGLEIDVT